jgi:hypothetical protein
VEISGENKMKPTEIIIQFAGALFLIYIFSLILKYLNFSIALSNLLLFLLIVLVILWSLKKLKIIK